MTIVVAMLVTAMVATLDIDMLVQNLMKFFFLHQLTANQMIEPAP